MRRQVHAYYSGQVQGVGFRFTAQDLAKDLGICGWARNLREGRVEVVAEAEERALKDFLERIRQKFFGYIQDIDAEWLEATSKFKDFQIK